MLGISAQRYFSNASLQRKCFVMNIFDQRRVFKEEEFLLYRFLLTSKTNEGITVYSSCNVSSEQELTCLLDVCETISDVCGALTEVDVETE